MRLIAQLVAFGLGVFLAIPTLADDSNAALSAGGITLLKSTDIRMASEDLAISTRLVRVRFSFENESAKDITTLVAFVLPDLDMSQDFESDMGGLPDTANFLNFKVWVDGRPLPAKLDQRAFLKGRDVTSLVVASGLPINMRWKAKLLERLAPGRKAALTKVGLFDRFNKPQWFVRTRFYWSQRFPSHKNIIIEHTYAPAVGGFFADARNFNFDHSPFCLDRQTRAQILRLLRKPNGLVLGGEVLYSLRTGNNWNGPIGRFHLVLDKTYKDSLLLSCWNALTNQTGPHTYEMTRTNYAPTRDIDLVALTWSKPPPE
jgi:hypothetical protein